MFLYYPASGQIQFKKYGETSITSNQIESRKYSIMTFASRKLNQNHGDSQGSESITSRLLSTDTVPPQLEVKWIDGVRLSSSMVALDTNLTETM